MSPRYSCRTEEALPASLARYMLDRFARTHCTWYVLNMEASDVPAIVRHIESDLGWRVHPNLVTIDEPDGRVRCIVTRSLPAHLPKNSSPSEA